MGVWLALYNVTLSTFEIFIKSLNSMKNLFINQPDFYLIFRFHGRMSVFEVMIKKYFFEFKIYL